MTQALGLARLVFALWLIAGGLGHFTGLPLPLPEGATPLAAQLLDAFRHSGLLDVAMAMELVAGALLLLGIATPFALALVMPLSTCALYWAVLLNQQPGWALAALVALALNAVLMFAFLPCYNAMLRPGALAAGESEQVHYNALFAWPALAAAVPRTGGRNAGAGGGAGFLLVGGAIYQWHHRPGDPAVSRGDAAGGTRAGVEQEMIVDRRGLIAGIGAVAVLGPAAALLAQGEPTDQAGGEVGAEAGTRPFGIQLWSVARQLADDFAGTIALLASLGYREIETYGPYAFSDPRQIASWNAVTPSLGFSGSGFFGHSTTEVRAIFDSHGLAVPSMHTDLFTLQTRMGELAEAAHGLGASYVTLPSLPAELRGSFDDYRRAADIFNAVGENASRHGVRFAYHNHGYGLVPVNGRVPLDTLLDATDPAHVFLELDTYWTIAGGADPVDYLTRYHGRYRLMHLKDMRGEHHFAGDGGNPAQWIELFPHMTWLGNGSLDLPGILAAARASGVDHFFVEQDRADDVRLAIAGSAGFLRGSGFR